MMRGTEAIGIASLAVAALFPSVRPVLAENVPPASDRARSEDAALASAFAVVGARIHPISSPTIDDGVMLVENGRIVAVGSAENLDLPQGYRVITGYELDLWPAMIDARTVLGLCEVGAVRATADYNEAGPINPGARSVVAINPASELIPVTRANGVLLAVSAPAGGLVSGLASVVALDGWTWEEMVRRDPVGLIINWPAVNPRRPPEPEKKEEEEKRPRRTWDDDVADLDEMIEEARAYARAIAVTDDPRDTDVQWDALRGVISGDVPVWIAASSEAQIRTAIDWVDRHGLRMVLLDGGDGWRCADALAERRIPVLTRTIHMPRHRHEPYDAPFSGPALLHAAGVRIGFRTDGSSNVRNLPSEAARAMAYGLPEEAARQAVTLTTAEILGIDDRYGSLEPGKSATFILIDGDLLDTRMNVKRAWLDGKELDLSSRHTRLWETYRNRPRAE